MSTANDIRQSVAQTFQQLGVTISDPQEIRETLRLDRGKVVARTYRYGHLMAMWLTEVGLVPFYDQDGNMLNTFSTLSVNEPSQARAA